MNPIKPPQHKLHLHQNSIVCALNRKALQLPCGRLTEDYIESYFRSNRGDSNCLAVQLPAEAREKFLQTNGYVSSDAVISKTARIHPTAVIAAEVIVAEGAEIGPNTIVGKNSYIGPNMKIAGNVVVMAEAHLDFQGTVAESVIINRGVIIENDELSTGGHIGPYSVIDEGSILLGKINLGESVYLGNFVKITGISEIGTLSAIAGNSELDTTTVGKNVYIGSSVRTEISVHIGNDSAISQRGGGKTYIKTGTSLGRGVTLENVKQIGENCEIGETACLRDIYFIGRKAVFAAGITVENCRLIKNNSRVTESIDYENAAGAFGHPDARRITINNIHAKNYEYN